MKEKKFSLEEAFKLAVNLHTKGKINDAKNIYEKILEAKPDHFFALDPVELDLMVQSIRKAEKSLGSGIKEVLKTEKELRNFAKRSIQAICKIPKGQELIEGVNFDVLRPGKKSRGLEPRFLDSLNGKKSKTDIDDGEGITDNS